MSKATEFARHPWAAKMLAVFAADKHRSWGPGWNRLDLAMALRITPTLAKLQADKLAEQKLLCKSSTLQVRKRGRRRKHTRFALGVGHTIYRLQVVPELLTRAALALRRNRATECDRMCSAFRRGNPVAMLVLLRILTQNPCTGYKLYAKAHLPDSVAKAAKRDLLKGRIIFSREGVYVASTAAIQRLQAVGARLGLPLCLA